MKLNLSFEEVEEIVKKNEFKNIPLATEILSDIRTPISLLKVLKNISKNCFILESAYADKRWGRYTFLGFEPSLELCATGNKISIKGSLDASFICENPKEYIDKIIEDNKSPRLKNLPSFTGGLVGYFAYDYIKYSEKKLNLDAKNDDNFKDLDLMLFDKVLAYDNYRQKIIIIVNMKTKNYEEEYERAKTELKRLVDIVKNGKEKKEQAGILKSKLKYLFNKEEFCEMIEKAKKYIYEGDIFQLVLSNRLEADFEGSLLNTYRVLRSMNPSPYMFYFSSDDIEIAGASPETLVKLEDQKLYTFPLAGTRKRGKDDKEDEDLIKHLLSDKKELAEHNMLVDLGRNDLGKISEFGSVEVEKYMEIQKFSHVMHIGSTVKGIIREDKKASDAISAVLPAGTLSGAPKIRACEIINELENNKRGIYGGAIGYIDFSGNMDTCISIRLAYKKNAKLYIRSGAGIVADSKAELEFEECVNKAKAVVTAVELAKEEA